MNDALVTISLSIDRFDRSIGRAMRPWWAPFQGGGRRPSAREAPREGLRAAPRYGWGRAAHDPVPHLEGRKFTTPRTKKATSRVYNYVGHFFSAPID